MQKYGLRIIFCYQYKLSRKDQISAKFNLHDLNKKKKKYVYRFQRFLHLYMEPSFISKMRFCCTEI